LEVRTRKLTLYFWADANDESYTGFLIRYRIQSAENEDEGARGF